MSVCLPVCVQARLLRFPFASHKQDLQLKGVWSSQALLTDESVSLSVDDDGDPRRLSVSQSLNLLGFFLFNANYYAIAPTAHLHAKQLGGAHLHGAILAGAPVAALLANVVFSRWSNTAYKAPLLASAVLLASGNVLYALSVPAQIPILAVVGRVLFGAGTVEAVNRRYIAQTVPVSGRTMVSSLFVGCGSVGMAAGPALAVPFAAVNYQLGPVRVTSHTGPAWMLASCWVLYAFLLLYYFEEPAGKESWGSRDEACPGEIEICSRGGNTPTSPGDNSKIKISPFVSCGLLRWPFIIALFIIFLVELIDEVLLNGAGMITGAHFDWGSHHVGAFLGFIGALVLPVNWFAGELATHISDRVVLLVATGFVSFGLIVGLQGPFFDYGRRQYMCGTGLAFCAAAVMEGVDTAIISRLAPPLLERSTFNSGLLATQVGAVGRVFGDVIIDFATDAGLMVNALYIPVFCSTLFAVVGTYAVYEEL